MASGRRWLWPALAVLLAVLPAAFWRGGVVEEEALGFLRNYWGERAVLQRIFDPRGYDFYQGRELSYAIDFLDAQWIRLLLARGVLFFVAPSALASALAVVAIGLWLLPRAFPRLPNATAWLLLAVYLSNFALSSTTGLLYRATKPLVAPLLLGLLLVALAEQRRPRLSPRAAFGVAFAAGLAMSLLDRQGLFYLLALLVVSCAAWLRTRRGAALSLGAAAAVGCWLLYNYALGPWIIHALNGYWPQMRFQRLRPTWLLQAAPWVEAARLLADWLRVLLGGLPREALAAAAVLGGLAWSLRRRPRPRQLALLTAAVLVGLLAQLAMLAIMVLRHPPVAWIDHRFWYYPLPFQALVVFALAWGLERAAVARGGALPRLVPVALAGLVVANLAQWPERRLLMESGPWFADVARRSELMVRSWRSGRTEPLLDGDHRRFYFECLDRFPRLAARAVPRVAEAAGIETVELQHGRLVAWAESEAHLVVTTADGGRHGIAGALLLRPGERVSLLAGVRPSRLLAEVRRTAEHAGPEPFRVSVELPPGSVDLVLLSSLPEPIPHPGSRSSRAFALLPPVAVWPERDP